jgi:transcriptional regulator with XRE-family HTH domain
MGRKIIADADSRKRIAALRANGLSLAKIGERFGVSRQAIHFTLRADKSNKLQRCIRCRVCDCELNPAGAMPRDDREVFCLACLAKRPDATFGEHLQAYRIAAGMRIVVLAKIARVTHTQISCYEEGRVPAAAWPTQRRLFQALSVKLVMELAGD